MDVYDAIPTCAARVLFLRHRECLPLIDRVKGYPLFSSLFTLIMEQLMKAENKCTIFLASLFEIGVRGFCYGQVNKLDTLKWLLSRRQYIQKYICEGLKWLVGEI
jgi:hypothetical protein